MPLPKVEAMVRAHMLIRVERSLVLSLFDSMAWIAENGSGAGDEHTARRAVRALREIAKHPARYVSSTAAAMLRKGVGPFVAAFAPELRTLAGRADPLDSAPDALDTLDLRVQLAGLRLARLPPSPFETTAPGLDIEEAL
jgi:hypothetical protein